MPKAPTPRRRRTPPARPDPPFVPLVPMPLIAGIVIWAAVATGGWGWAIWSANGTLKAALEAADLECKSTVAAYQSALGELMRRLGERAPVQRPGEGGSSL